MFQLKNYKTNFEQICSCANCVTTTTIAPLQLTVPATEISTFHYNPSSHDFSTFRDWSRRIGIRSHAWRASFPYSPATAKSLRVQLNSVFQFVSLIAFVPYGMRPSCQHLVLFLLPQQCAFH